MVAISDRTVLALLLVFVTGRAEERVEARRRGRIVLMSCIFEARRAVDCMSEFLWEMPIKYG